MGIINCFIAFLKLLIVALLFGTKKIRSAGGDLGGAIKSFRKAIKDVDKPILSSEIETNKQSQT
jgi:sec-independent protein translocase protein TatA